MAGLACYRLAQLVALDDGPFDLLLRLRGWAGAEDTPVETGLGRLLCCPYCLGVWFAMLCAALALWPTWWGDVILAVWGLAGVQAALQGASGDGR